MFQKVLVALDFLDFNDVVFERALALAVAMDSQLMLVHALGSDREGGPPLPTAMSWNYSVAMGPVAMGGAAGELGDRMWTVYQNAWQKYAQRERTLLKQYAQRAIAAGVATEVTQSVQMPGRLICEVADSWHADTIVVGSHGRRGLSELLIGSVSNYVTHHVRPDGPVSVLVVRLNMEGEQCDRDLAKHDLAKHDLAEHNLAEHSLAEKVS